MTFGSPVCKLTKTGVIYGPIDSDGYFYEVAVQGKYAVRISVSRLGVPIPIPTDMIIESTPRRYIDFINMSSQCGIRYYANYAVWIDPSGAVYAGYPTEVELLSHRLASFQQGPGRNSNACSSILPMLAPKDGYSTVKHPRPATVSSMQGCCHLCSKDSECTFWSYDPDRTVDNCHALTNVTDVIESRMTSGGRLQSPMDVTVLNMLTSKNALLYGAGVLPPPTTTPPTTSTEAAPDDSSHNTTTHVPSPSPSSFSFSSSSSVHSNPLSQSSGDAYVSKSASFGIPSLWSSDGFRYLAVSQIDYMESKPHVYPVSWRRSHRLHTDSSSFSMSIDRNSNTDKDRSGDATAPPPASPPAIATAAASATGTAAAVSSPPTTTTSTLAASSTTTSESWLRWFIQGTNQVDLYIIIAPTMTHSVTRMWQITGGPKLPPLYAFGMQVAMNGLKDDVEIEDMLTRFRHGRYPIDAVAADYEWYGNVTDIDVPVTGSDTHLDFRYSNVTFPSPRSQLEKYHTLYGVRFGGTLRPRLTGRRMVGYAKSRGWLLSNTRNLDFSKQEVSE